MDEISASAIKKRVPWNKGKSMRDYPHVGFQKGHKVFLVQHSEETRRKLSEMKKGKPLSESHKAALNMDNLKLGQGWNKGLPAPWAKGAPPRYNEDNHEWKGNEASYQAKHMWVYRRLGKPKRCSSCSLDDPEKMYHWANISGQYKRDVRDWVRLCVPCHMAYDKGRRKN